MIFRIKKELFNPIRLLVFFMVFLIFGGSFFSCKGKKEKPHILLITIDTLRRDHLGVYGYQRKTSPFIDELAKKGLRFKNVITPIPLTAPSHASILTSLHPLTHRLTLNGNKLNNKVQTIAEVLQKNGYYTIGAVGVKLLTAKNRFSQGFDSFSDTWDNKIKYHTVYERIAPSVNESIFNQVEEYLSNPQKKQKPLFIWVHYFDPHFPYHDWKDVTFTNKVPKNEERVGMRKHDKEIFYTDQHIKKLHRFLEKKGLQKKLLTCITADHGEEFGEHGHVNCHVDIYSETTFVPLIFQGYRVPKNKVIGTNVSTMDVAVTLLGTAGLSFEYPCDGIDLFKIAKNPEKNKDRKFLIIGDSLYTRALQLIGHPYGYIRNFDHHYKYWYVFSDQDNHSNLIPEKSFENIPDKKVRRINDNSIKVIIPHDNKRGLKYLVLKADVKNNKGIYIRMHLEPNNFTNRVDFHKAIGGFTIIFPTVFRDRVESRIKFDTGTSIDNIRYTYITRKEFLQLKEVDGKRKNRIFNKILTLRKKNPQDELFDLSNDIDMEKSLAAEKRLKPLITRYKKLIYNAFNYYYQKGEKIVRGMKIQELSEEDRKMLKSLGYL